ncbi:phosphonate C-P lyase system protein PhnL [Afifella sp. IM 167]|uniref:phosphonate C-P lyase system protein PhnL n=1 Tax=Afifella sp. IM 167 TaxID=2033586 RepID=UPI001CC96C6F|nr:phosphonate C-P lyase system protein PhnL [Afifella sp. IM 167]MBZ8132026.1 phosphonate C-P lyase system protein PhnL [Afifella sp. IM 167]
MQPRLAVSGLSKSFTMHLRGGIHIPVLSEASFEVYPGECVALGGPSGAGKSSILKMVYGNYAADAGSIVIARKEGGPVDIAIADPRMVLSIRRSDLGYVSQFLRVVPRVAARDLVAEPLVERGAGREEALDKADALLHRLNLPERLWHLPPATFSGGEQQRVNIARGFIAGHPLLLLDEPTASLDAANRDVVISLIAEGKAAGTSFLGIFHDAPTRGRVAEREVDVTAFSPKAAA